jgi:hypothetical protein
VEQGGAASAKDGCTLTPVKGAWRNAERAVTHYSSADVRARWRGASGEEVASTHAAAGLQCAPPVDLIGVFHPPWTRGHGEHGGTAGRTAYQTSREGGLDLTPQGHSIRIHSSIRGPSPWLVLLPSLARRRARVPSVRLPIDAKNARFPVARGAAAAPRAPSTAGGPNGAPYGLIFLTLEPLGRIPPSPPPPPSLLPFPFLPQDRSRAHSEAAASNWSRPSDRA